MFESDSNACDSYRMWNRRRFLATNAMAAGMAGSWLTPIAEAMARAQDRDQQRGPAKSLLILWMQGGPSQFETFDPHPGTPNGGLVSKIKTKSKHLEIADTLPRVAEQMHRASVVRSVVSKEGDHERATYNVKTGWRPDPTLIHPSIGSIACHQLPENLEIPRHISILSSQWPARGGYLGSSLDAFQINDPKQPLPNLRSYIPEDRFESRLASLSGVVEREFARGRLKNLDSARTQHETSTRRAIEMMGSSLLSAFEISDEPQGVIDSFGDSPFGRGCLAGIRLIEAGVKCVEVELNGWDTHINNHELQSSACKTLDAALAATLDQLHQRGMLDSTLVFCGGEFGRTPQINPAGGRDHWPHGFSILMAGGGIQGGRVIGATNPQPPEIITADNRDKAASDAVEVPDIHATILNQMGIDFAQELQTPIGRPLQISTGRPIAALTDV